MNINRRDFFNKTALGIGAISLASITSLCSSTPEVPLYKQFVWVDLPEFLSYRYNENNELGYRRFAVRTFKTKLYPISDIDLTYGNVIDRKNAHTANDLLYKQAKLFGLTHLYCIRSEEFTIDRGSYRYYDIRGATVPIEYKNCYKSWRELFNEVKKVELKYHFSWKNTPEKFQVLSLKSQKSRVEILKRKDVVNI